MSEQMYVEAFGSDDEVTFNLAVSASAEPVDIHLRTSSGEVSLSGTERPDIQVWLEVDGKRSDEKVVTASWDGRRLDVAPAKTNGRGHLLRHNATFDVRVEVPRSLLPRSGGPGIVARLNTASGEVTASELAGDIRLQSASGGLSMSRLEGQIECQTASGSIDIDAVRGLLKVSAVSGDVSLSDAILDRWEMNTVSGGISGEVVLTGAGPYRINTVSGDTDLHLGVLSGTGHPDAFTVEASTMSGDIEVDGEARKLSKRRWHIGSGLRPAGTIRVTSVSGDASLTVESTAVDGDFRSASGQWVGERWAASTEATHGQDDGPDRTDRSVHGLPERIEETVNRAIGKVDWKGIDRSIDDALSTAFGAPTRSAKPVPPTPPTPPDPRPAAPPQAPSAPPPAPAPSDGSIEPVDGTPATEPDPVEPIAPAVSEEEYRLEILRLIERGELSVEDGMARLDAPQARHQPTA